MRRKIYNTAHRLIYIIMLILASYLIIKSLGDVSGDIARRLAEFIMGFAWLLICAVANEEVLK